MKPYHHDNIMAKKFGGKPEDYSDINDFLDSSKATIADVRHRALLHNSFGCYLVEQIFGRTRINSDGKVYSPRDVAEEHIIQDLGFIPTPEHYLSQMAVKHWMSGTVKKTKQKPTVNENTVQSLTVDGATLYRQTLKVGKDND